MDAGDLPTRADPARSRRLSPGDRVPAYDRTADAYRRRIVARTVDRGRVVCDLADDFHHFRVVLDHDGDRVTGVVGEAIRWPWSTCPAAAEHLAPLVGMPLSTRFTDAAGHAEPRRNCTHQFDAAAHAALHARRVGGRRVHDVEVVARDDRGGSRLRAWRDGVLVHEWTVGWDALVGAPPPFPDAPWRGGFMAWAEANLAPDEAESAIVARRAATIGIGRGWPWESFARASEVPIGASGVCFTMTPGTAEHGAREHGMVRDFAADPEALVRATDGAGADR